jgi:uncharacterized coiled-coil protein SlyX
MKGWNFKKQPPDYVEGRYFPVLERITKLEKAVEEALKKRDDKIAELHFNLANLRGQIRAEVATQLSKGIDTQVEERLDDLDDRLLKQERTFDEFKEVTDHNVKLLDQIVYRHEVNLSEHTETLTQLAKTPQPIENRFDFCEGKTYSVYMTQQLEQAWKKVNSPTLIDPFSRWLTNEQRSLLPLPFDVIAAVYLNTLGAPEYAHVSNLAAQIGWLKKGEVSQVASSQVAKGYLAERWLTEGEWSLPGSRPRVFRLTDRCLALFFASGTSNMAGSSTHRAMERTFFREAISASPPRLFMAIPQVTGESRPDGVLVERVDAKCWDWQNACAVNFETDQEVRAHSSTQPGSEGEVYLNLLRPFAQGCKGLIVVCLQDSAEKLAELVNELPSWLARRIHIQVVYV